MDLSKKRIVVTGADGALGRAVVHKAESYGASVISLTHRPDSGVNDKSVVVDLANREETRQCFFDLGRFDAIFNLVGGFAMGASTWADDDDQWDQMFAVNVRTLRNVLKSVVPMMLENGGGRIVNVGAYGALFGSAGLSAYGASKRTVMQLTEALSEEVKHKGINVNAVLPTVLDSPANRQNMPDADPGEWVAPEALADVICFLGSEGARAVHGALVPVRGLV